MDNYKTILESLYYVANEGVIGKDTLVERYSEALRSGKHLNRSFENWLEYQTSFDTWTLREFIAELKRQFQDSHLRGYELVMVVKELSKIQNQVTREWYILPENFYSWVEKIWDK